MSSAPASLLFLRPDTYGDLILFEPVLRLTREAWPEAKIGVLIREAYLDVAPLIGSEGIEWLTTARDPYRQGPRDNRPALEALRETVLRFSPDGLVAACFERTWLEAAVAVFVPHARQVCLGTRDFDPLTRSALNAEFSVDWTSLYPTKVHVEADAFEWEKNLRLVDALKRSLGAATSCSGGLKGARSFSGGEKSRPRSVDAAGAAGSPRHAGRMGGIGEWATRPHRVIYFWQMVGNKAHPAFKYVDQP